MEKIFSQVPADKEETTGDLGLGRTGFIKRSYLKEEGKKLNKKGKVESVG